MISRIRYYSTSVRQLPQALGLTLLLPLLLAAQAGNPSQVAVAEILQNLRAHFDRIQDYQVDLQVSLDMPMLRMPRKKMTFTFKQPDKTRLEAKGFAMVPRRGLALSPDSLFQQLQDLTIAGDTLLNGHTGLILRGGEKGPDNMMFVADVFVDRELWLVRGITTYLDDHEVFRLWTDYLEVAPGIHLPAETNLRFQLDERFIRGRPQGPRSYDPDIQEPVLDDLEDITGEASIVFSNYRVNLGIPDNFFHDEEKP